MEAKEAGAAVVELRVTTVREWQEQMRL